MDQRRKWAILSGVMLAMLLSSLDQTIVSTAMPTIVQELQGIEHLSWVFTAYMLGSTVTVPIYGKLSDLFGRKKLYIIGIVIFLAASVLCGLSQNMEQLIIFRGLQGIGGGAMMVNSFAIIGDVFPPAERGKFQGIIGAVFGLSSVAGPLLGGWITDHTSWRWVFYVNIPLGMVAILVLTLTLPLIRPEHKSRKIDWWGGLLLLFTLVPWLLALVWGGSEYAWGSVMIISLASAGVVSFFLFIRAEKKAINPILALDLFRNRIFVTCSGALFLTAMGMFGAIMYIPLFSQGVIGGSATHAGLILTPMMIALVIASVIVGQIISRTGKYKSIAVFGTMITSAALFFFGTITSHTSNGELVLRMVILGAGLGSTMPIFTLAVQSAFRRERLGEVTAGTQLFRSVGATVGIAILGGVMNMQLEKQISSMEKEPFAARLNHVQAGTLNPSLVQNVLNTEYQLQIRQELQDLLPESSNKANEEFTSFIGRAKDSFSSALDSVFIVAGIMMLVALVVVWFLPAIPLRKSHLPASEEAGIILEEELGQHDPQEKDVAVRKNRN